MESVYPVLPPRKVADSRSEMTELVLPNDANTLGNLLGGGWGRGGGFGGSSGNSSSSGGFGGFGGGDAGGGGASSSW